MLHKQIKQISQRRPLKLSELKPNSRELAKRLIDEGRLVKHKDGFIWHEVVK